MSIRVLVVDDVPETTEALKMMYTFVGGEVVGSAANTKDALELLEQTKPEMISIDIQLGDENGLLLCKEVRARYPDIFIVVCSMEASLHQTALKSGANHFASKPVSSGEIRKVVQDCKYQHVDTSTSSENQPLDIDALLSSALGE